MADGKAREIRGEGAGPADLLDAAAACFMEQGFAATSIDDVARRLNATKGRIYHYYASKTDLFFDVHREGMDRLFVAVSRAADAASGPAGARLTAMLEAHAVAMMDNHAFMAVVVQGVHMHRMAPTTPGQRRTLDALMDMRRRFEGLFRATLEAAVADGSAAPCNPSVAVKAMLGAINWMSIWYRPRAGETEGDRQALAADMVRQIKTGFAP